MKKLLVALFAVCAAISAVAQDGIDPLNAVVRINTIYCQPNYFVPWQSKMQDACCGSGVVISGNRILTNAHNITDATYISVIKQSLDDEFPARVLAVDHNCDLALLEVEDKSFFNDIRPFEIGQTPPVQTQVIAAGFPIGGDALSITQGVISRIEIQNYTHSFKSLLSAQLDAAINPGNSGGPVICDGKIVGIAFQGNSQGEGLGYMIPTEIICHFLKDIEDGHTDGFGFAGFRFATLENPATRRFLKMKDGMTGIRVISVNRENTELLNVDDVVMAIDGVKIANNGNIRLPNGEPRAFQTIVTQKQLGENVSLTILRDGKEVAVEIPVRHIGYKCKEFLYDKLPDYYIVGGFVFTTLSYSFLDEWEKNDPPSKLTDLMFIEKESPEEETVVLSLVLGDKVNVGYQNFFANQLTKVNGKKLANLRELIDVVENSTDEFITFTFSAEPELPVTLDLNELRAATPSILERYRIPADRSQSMQ